MVGDRSIFTVFCKNKESDPVTSAKRALQSLHYQTASLMSLKVLVLKETGPINGELSACMGIILRRRRENDIFDGFLIIADGDKNLLSNIDGTDVFLSTTLIFAFETLRTVHSGSELQQMKSGI